MTTTENGQRDELAEVIHNALGDVTGIYDTSENEDQRLAAVILAKGYRKPRTVASVDGATRAQMVDIVLAHAGTPRHELFEYPNRADDSLKMIRKADAAVLDIITALWGTEAEEAA